MSQSLAKVNVHIVFSTKYAQHVIPSKIRNELHAYMIGVLKNLGSYVYALYANPNHVHILSTLPRTLTLADLVSKTKTSTTKWLKLHGITNFGWQDGYGVFSVSASMVDKVRNYILHQEEHHRKANFQDELRRFLNEYGLEYDERYLWD
jgi:REP element-mobilizing transposase RayT